MLLNSAQIVILIVSRLIDHLSRIRQHFFQKILKLFSNRFTCFEDGLKNKTETSTRIALPYPCVLIFHLISIHRDYKPSTLFLRICFTNDCFKCQLTPGRSRRNLSLFDPRKSIIRMPKSARKAHRLDICSFDTSSR